MKRFAVPVLLFAVGTSCGMPGMEVVPQPGDFAFLEVTLKG